MSDCQRSEHVRSATIDYTALTAELRVNANRGSFSAPSERVGALDETSKLQCMKQDRDSAREAYVKLNAGHAWALP